MSSLGVVVDACPVCGSTITIAVTASPTADEILIMGEKRGYVRAVEDISAAIHSGSLGVGAGRFQVAELIRAKFGKAPQE